MTPENTEKLYAAFPYLYRGRNKSPQESSMGMGFTFEDGWFDLVWDLSQKIEDAAFSLGLKPNNSSWPEAMQVKEKLGSLRFHLANKQARFADEIIAEARDQSMLICELCGSTQTLVSIEYQNYAAKTICAKHSKTTASFRAS